jgi:NAD(P)H-nitrite reductase large subunit
MILKITFSDLHSFPFRAVLRIDMLVCHCRRVCHRHLVEAIRSGAASMDAIGEACGAGTVCGGCRPAIVEVLCEQQVADGGTSAAAKVMLTLAPLHA